MGYSMSVSCRSQKLRDRLAEFLREHLKPFCVACEEADDIRADYEKLTGGHADLSLWPIARHLPHDPTKDILVGEGVCYGGGPSKVGFNFGNSYTYGIYMRAILAWAAQHVGRRRPLNRLAETTGVLASTHYYTYDREPTPVVVAADIADWPSDFRKYAETHWLVDEFGMRVNPRLTHYPTPADEAGKAILRGFQEYEKGLERVTRREMERLDALWKEQNE
jgi:hypothetical protein